jgi:hypothetical protein
MEIHINDDDVAALAASAHPYSLAILRWANREHSDEVEIGAAHQRRMVQLRRDGKISILCPVASDSICGVAILTVPLEDATAIMRSDPCVQSGIMTCEVLPCHSFPGDSLPKGEDGNRDQEPTLELDR